MLIIDRFEGDFALIETSNGMVNISKNELPANAKEGDVLTLGIDENESVARKKRIDGMMSSIFKD